MMKRPTGRFFFELIAALEAIHSDSGKAFFRAE
jgi:hypothetical protein